MKAECEIRIFASDGTFLGIVDNAESVQLTRRHRGPGHFSLKIQADKGGAASFCGTDHRLVIGGSPEKTVLVRDWEYERTEEGRTLVVRGVTPSGLAARRIVVPPTEAEKPGSMGWERASGTGETLLRFFAAWHMAAPRDAKRTFPHFQLEPARGLDGESFHWQSRFEPLDRVLEQIAERADLGWRVDYDMVMKEFTFCVVPGETRTLGSEGPVLFGMELDNVGRTLFRECHIGGYSTAYAGGEGQDEGRLIQVVDAQAEGFAREERFLDVGGAATVEELLLAARKQMAGRSESRTILCEKLREHPFRFEKEYFLGDKITFSLPEIPVLADVRLTEVTEVWEGTGKRVDMVFGPPEPNLLTALRGREERSPVR